MTDQNVKMPDLSQTIYQLKEEVKRADYIDTDYLDCVDVNVLKDALALLKQQEHMQNGAQHQCNECKYYEGVHNTEGHAPCKFWNIGGVMWNDYCSRFHDFRIGGEVVMTREEIIEFLSDQLREHTMMYTLRNTYANTLQMFKEYDKISNSYKEAIKLLENTEPKMLALEEADKAPYVWLESKYGDLGVRRIRIVHVGSTAISIQAFGKLDTMVTIYEFEKCFRCWDKEPTDEQRKMVKWE